MKICIYGIGAVGGLIGARLAAEGSTVVSAVARGATLAALNSGGLRLQSGDHLTQTQIRAAEHPADLGVQDIVVVSVKGPALAAVAAGIAPLLGPDTVVLSAMNGVPWWFFDGAGGQCAGMHLESVDPGGVVTAAIPARRVVGCVVHLNVAAPEPGLVLHRMGNGLIVGEPDGSASARVQQIAQLLARTGFDVTISPRIQNDIWYKLWGNLTFNPISALTGAAGDRILADPLVLAFCTSAMEEAARIGERIGCEIRQTPQERHAVTRKLGAFRTSMLQDAEAGRPLEIDAIVGAAKEIGERVGVATPTIDALLGLIRLYGRTRGLYPAQTEQTGSDT